MHRMYLGKKIKTNIYNTGVVSRALSSQTFSEKGFDITPEQYLILELLIDNDEMYQRQIAEITHKDRANVARIIKILKDKGLIEKIPQARGRKIYKIVGTEKGKKVKDEIYPTIIELRKILYANISKEDLITTFNTIQKIYENAKDKVKLQI